MEERSQPARDEDDDGVCLPLEVGDETFAFVALEVVQYQDAGALLDDASVVGTELLAIRDPKGAPPLVTPAFLPHAEGHASRGVPVLGAVCRKDLCRDRILSRLSRLALPGRARRDE